MMPESCEGRGHSYLPPSTLEPFQRQQPDFFGAAFFVTFLGAAFFFGAAFFTVAIYFPPFVLVSAKPGTNILVSLQFIAVNGIFFNDFFHQRLSTARRRNPKRACKILPMCVN